MKWILSLMLLTVSLLGASEIQTNELKEWIDTNKEFVLLDARSKEYYNEKVLPHAQWLPYNTDENAIAQAIPSKNDVVVVYCGGPGCPASGWLGDRLKKMGYTHVVEYAGGLKEWVKAGYPLVQPKS